MTIKGTLEKKETNGYGYTTIWVSKTRYGCDKKGDVPAEVGDQVEFEAFDKPGKDGRMWPTAQLTTIKKSAGESAAPAAVGAAPAARSVGYSPSAGSGASRDTYWADKAQEDAKKDPRIVYQSSYERAILFTDLAIKNKCFEALEKAKATARLEVLTAFVDEQADRIMKGVYAAQVPSAASQALTSASQEAVGVATAESDSSDEKWS